MTLTQKDIEELTGTIEEKLTMIIDAAFERVATKQDVKDLGARVEKRIDSLGYEIGQMRMRVIQGIDYQQIRAEEEFKRLYSSCTSVGRGFPLKFPVAPYTGCDATEWGERPLPD